MIIRNDRFPAPSDRNNGSCRGRRQSRQPIQPIRILGHLEAGTESMYNRYNIVSALDLAGVKDKIERLLIDTLSDTSGGKTEAS